MKITGKFGSIIGLDVRGCVLIKLHILLLFFFFLSLYYCGLFFYTRDYNIFLQLVIRYASNTSLMMFLVVKLFNELGRNKSCTVILRLGRPNSFTFATAYAGAIRRRMKKKKKNRRNEKRTREEEWSKDAYQRMGDALVTHDGPRGQTAEKMYIRSDTAKDMAADRKGRKGVDWCFPMPRIRYLHYFDIIIPVALYISRGSIFALQRRASGASQLHIVRYGVLFYQFLFFFRFICFDDRCFCTLYLHIRV